MSRYVDADMLIRKYIDTDIEKFSNSDVKIVLENLKQNILKAPSIDIVRCGECKYYIDNMCDCYSLYGDLSGDLIGVSFEPNEDFFCSYGSRSEKPNNSERSSE